MMQIDNLAKQLFDQKAEITDWLADQFQQTPPVITTSVDLRNAGFKLAPIDTNLFPAGFNNLSAAAIQKGVTVLRSTLQALSLHGKQLVLIPENQSSNPYYWESLANLHQMLTEAGCVVRIGSFLDTLTTPKKLVLQSGRTIVLEPLQHKGDRISLADFDPDCILLNNDLSNGIPEIIKGITQEIHPTYQLGWCSRLKSRHFQYYAEVAQIFAQQFAIDPWLISPLFKHCGPVDFITGLGEEAMLANIKQVLEQMRDKYAEYGITHQPFVAVKADMGTYGMGIIMLHDPEQLQQLNRKQRNRMLLVKERQKLDKVIIQEGVPTHEVLDGVVAEPVVYLIGGQVVGGFYRMHPDKSDMDNLNTPGMHFAPLELDRQQPRNYLYVVIARLAALAAARELANLGRDE